MKIKYFVFCIVMFLCCGAPCCAFTESKELKYDVESMEIKDSKIIFDGWARKTANTNGDHNIGGKNLEIYIAAVNVAGMNNSVSEIKSKIKVNNAYSYSNPLISEGKYYVIKENNYDNGNLLFNSLCLRNCAGGTCCESPVDSNKKSSCKFTKDNNGEYQPKDMDGDNDRDSTCVSYDTGFKIAFEFEKLREKLIVGTDESVKVQFLIFITHYPNDGYKYFEFNSYERVGEFNGNKNVYVRNLGVYDGVCQGCGAASNLMYNIDITTAKEFYFDTYHALLMSLNGGNLSYHSGKYFAEERTYTIVDRDEKKISSAGTGIVPATPISIYKLKTDGDSNSNNYYSPGNSEDYWSWSTWGTVSGETTLTLYNDVTIRNETCVNAEINAQCVGIIKNYNCVEKLEKSNEDIEMQIDDNNLKLTTARCRGVKPKITLNRFYDVTEEITLTPEYSDVDNNEYTINSRDFIIEIDKGRGFGFDFSLERTDYNVIPLNDDYYTVEFIYDDGANQCATQTVNMSEERLLNIVNNDTKNIINQLKRSISNNITKSFEDFDDQRSLQRYKFPDNNYNDVILSNNMAKKAIKMISAPTSDLIELGITPAYILNTNVIEGEKIKTIGFVEYGVSRNLSNYNMGNNIYYLPFGFNNSNTAELRFEFNVTESYFNKVVYKFCEFKGMDSKLENYRYRVVDLSNPFPNVKPRDGGRASNWFNMWINRNSDTFLNNRRYDNNVESYKFDLNIKEIREYNLTQGKYLNTSVDSKGESSYINGNNNYFISKEMKNVLYKKVGGSGVE